MLTNSVHQGTEKAVVLVAGIVQESRRLSRAEKGDDGALAGCSFEKSEIPSSLHSYACGSHRPAAIQPSMQSAAQPLLNRRPEEKHIIIRFLVLGNTPS